MDAGGATGAVGNGAGAVGKVIGAKTPGEPPTRDPEKGRLTPLDRHRAINRPTSLFGSTLSIKLNHSRELLFFLTGSSRSSTPLRFSSMKSPVRMSPAPGTALVGGGAGGGNMIPESGGKVGAGAGVGAGAVGSGLLIKPGGAGAVVRSSRSSTPFRLSSMKSEVRMFPEPGTVALGGAAGAGAAAAALRAASSSAALRAASSATRRASSAARRA